MPVIMVGASLAGLQDHLKLAREYAVEGLYDTSIIFFDGAIAQINKYFSTLSLSRFFLFCMKQNVRSSFGDKHMSVWVCFVNFSYFTRKGRKIGICNLCLFGRFKSC